MTVDSHYPLSVILHALRRHVITMYALHYNLMTCRRVYITLLCSVLQMTWPFWRISNHSDLAALHHALDLGYL